MLHATASICVRTSASLARLDEMVSSENRIIYNTCPMRMREKSDEPGAVFVEGRIIGRTFATPTVDYDVSLLFAISFSQLTCLGGILQVSHVVTTERRSSPCRVLSHLEIQ